MKMRVVSLVMGVLVVAGSTHLTGYADGIAQDEKPAVADTVETDMVECPYEDGTVEAAIYKGLMNMEDVIDVSSYQLEMEDFYIIFDKMVLSNPELFHISHMDYGVSWEDEYVGEIYPIYALADKSQYDFFGADVELAAEKALSGITDSMTDFEKLLYLHDYVLKNCDYSLGGMMSSNIYGCLVDKRCNSYGMSLAYKYLVEKAGLTCEVVIGNGHSWNAVLLNGEYYFVDLCFDNPPLRDWESDFDKVGHSYFLLTAAELLSVASSYHEFWYSDIFPTDTTYVGAWFKKVDSPFSYYNGEWYYWWNIDGEEKSPAIGKTDNPEKAGTNIYALDSFVWKLNNDSEKNWKGYRGNVDVCAERGELYFCSSNQIFCMDLENLSAEPKSIYTVDTSIGYIYGLKVEGDNLIYGISTSPYIAETLHTVALSRLLDDFTTGDVGGNGRIDANDALEILKKIVGMEVNDFIELAADCDGNNRIDANDALWILKDVADIEMDRVK